jgi:enolase
MIAFYKNLKERFSIVGLEDPLMEDDFAGWGELRKELSDILIVGDDLLTTNIKRMQRAEENNSCNAMILKINQIGTVSEALQSAKTAQEFQWKIIVSHRSGETNDNFIADFAVGIGADYIKSGAPARGERVAKYNRLLEIEDEKQQQV